MELKNSKYLLIISLHLCLGGVFYAAPYLAKFYGLLIVILGFGIVLK
jgi:hypothetical protein